VTDEAKSEPKADEFHHASDSFDWCDARIFELNLTRKMLSPDELAVVGAEIDKTLGLLSAESARLLSVMKEQNVSSER
jgi:hypothetical protein